MSVDPMKVEAVHLQADTALRKEAQKRQNASVFYKNNRKLGYQVQN